MNTMLWNAVEWLNGLPPIVGGTIAAAGLLSWLVITLLLAEAAVRADDRRQGRRN